MRVRSILEARLASVRGQPNPGPRAHRNKVGSFYLLVSARALLCIPRSLGPRTGATVGPLSSIQLAPAARRALCFCSCCCFWPSPRNSWRDRTRVKARTPTHQRLALMCVRRCERFGLGPLFIAFAFYGGGGFVSAGARVCGLAFRALPDATTGASRAMRRAR